MRRFLQDWGVFLVLVIFAREFLVTGLRLVAASQGLVLAAERTGKIKTVLQLVSVSVLLLAHALHVDFNQNTAAHDTHLVGPVVVCGGGGVDGIFRRRLPRQILGHVHRQVRCGPGQR